MYVNKKTITNLFMYMVFDTYMCVPGMCIMGCHFVCGNIFTDLHDTWIAVQQFI